MEAKPGYLVGPGDNLWADQDSFAELRIGSQLVEVAPETSLTVIDPDISSTRLQLSLGSAIVQLLDQEDSGRFTLDTPNLAFVPLQQGEYRIDVNAEGDETDATVWRGQGQATGGGARYLIEAGQRARLAGTDHVAAEIGSLPEPDGFDRWALGRVRREENVQADSRGEPGPSGEENPPDSETDVKIQGNGPGHWHYEPGIGPVWSPDIWSEELGMPEATPYAVILVAAPYERGYPSARPQEVAVQTSVPPNRFPTNQPADVQRTWQSRPLSGGPPAAISRWPKISSPPPERSNSYHQSPMPMPRAGQNQNRIQRPPPTALNSRLPRPQQTSFLPVHNSASESRSASPAVKSTKPQNR